MIDESELRDLLDIPDGIDTLQAVKEFYREYQLLLEREMIGSEASTGVLIRRLETEKELKEARAELFSRQVKIEHLYYRLENLQIYTNKLEDYIAGIRDRTS